MKWSLKPAEPAQVEVVAAELCSSVLSAKDSHVAPTLARLLLTRDITDAECAARFLSPSSTICILRT